MKIVTGIFLLVMASFVLSFFVVSSAETGNEKQVSDAKQHILGRWIRPDGGYILEFKQVGTDAALKAFYFNPSPINVSSVEIHRDKDTIALFVELRDVNYPGSTYNLQYDPKTDRLTGTYYQAVDKITYDVVFTRFK